MQVKGDEPPAHFECLFCGKGPKEVFLMFAQKLKTPFGERDHATICCECIDQADDYMQGIAKDFIAARQKPMH